jgi:hypothetical protein
MDINSELKDAQLEILSSDPSSPIKGRVWHKSTTEPVKVSDGTNTHVVLTDRNFESLIDSYIDGRLSGAASSYKNLFTALVECGTDADAQYNGTYGAIPLFFRPANLGTFSEYLGLQPFYINASDLPSVDGVTSKLRIRANVFTNDVANTSTYTFGLYPVTRPTTSGTASALNFTIGTVVTGSTAVITSPGADASVTAVGSDFEIPSSGFYVLAVDYTDSIGLNGFVQFSATLQTRNA